MIAGYDTIIVGGGLVGAAIACGLAARGRRVAVLDGDDRDLRASRGNFGLIWVQGKGADCAAYARWSGLAARSWPDFAAELQAETGVDIGLQQNGGYDFCLDEVEWQARGDEMRRVSEHTDGAFEYEMLEVDELRRRIPEVSSEIRGASYSAQDGHVNPLYLLRGLHRRMQDLGKIRINQGGIAGDGQQVGCIHYLQCASHPHQRTEILSDDVGHHRVTKRLITFPVPIGIDNQLGYLRDYCGYDTLDHGLSTNFNKALILACHASRLATR